MSAVGRAREQLYPLEVSVAGGVSGAVTRLLLQPLDVAKIRLQLQVESLKSGKPKYRGLAHLLISLPREEGLQALWKGHLPAQALSFTYGLASFAVFESLTGAMATEERSSGPLVRSGLHFLCGGLGGCAGTLASLPFDVLRTRLVAQSRPVYTSSRHAMGQLWMEGGAPSFFKGLVPALLSTAPQSGLQFGFYSLLTFLREILVKGREERISLLGSFTCGGLAGLGSKAILYPLDVSKKRLQVSGWGHGREGLGATPSYKGLNHCLREVFKSEGMRGLYKGVSPALLKAVLSTSLHFSVYEQVCAFLLLRRH